MRATLADHARLSATDTLAPLGTLLDQGARISLGGVQEKMVVVIDGDRVGLPLGATPSTHILKPTQLAPDGSERFPGIVDVEHFCLRLAGHLAAERYDPARGIAFTVPNTTVMRVADRDVLCVQRYDRSLDQPTRRIHQEDGCQMLGLPPDRKYQRLTNEEPSLAGFATAIRRFGAEPLTDLRALLQLLVLTVCVGNADLHAKNLSLLHNDGVRFAPIYDVVSTAVYAGVSQELGLRVAGEYHLDVTGNALVSEAAGWGIGGAAAARSTIEAMATGLTESVSTVRDQFRSAGRNHPKLDELHDRIVRVADTLRRVG